MRRGDFPAAWAISDDVLTARASTPCWRLPRHQQWLWRGESLAGKHVLVRCFHGLGDTIQFIRFVPLLRRVAARVTVEAQSPLLPLLRAVPGIDQLVPLTDGTPDVAYDVEVEVMELAHIHRVTTQSLPREIPYLHAPASTTLSRGAGTIAVGVVWAAGDWDPRRSMDAAMLAPLTTLPGVELHALQRGHALNAWRTDWGRVSGSDDIVEVAGIMRMLDLVVTVDSMPAHLAGALGVPAWTLLHAAADWRWMDEREDSPWYPSMRLFRQPTAGDWPAVIARVGRELLRFNRAQ